MQSFILSGFVTIVCAFVILKIKMRDLDVDFFKVTISNFPNFNMERADKTNTIQRQTTRKPLEMELPIFFIWIVGQSA